MHAPLHTCHKIFSLIGPQREHIDKNFSKRHFFFFQMFLDCVFVCTYLMHVGEIGHLPIHSKITMAGDVVPYYTVTALVPTLK